MSIRRSATAGDRVTVLQRAALQDTRLSFRARGILGAVLSRPADWTTNAERLACESPGEGRDAIRKALKELEAVGYLVRRRVQGDGGRWATTWELSDEPAKMVDPGVVAGHTEDGFPAVGKPDVGGPDSGRPDVGESGLYYRDLETGSRDTSFGAPSAGAASADETAPATKPTSSKPRATERGTRLPEDWQPDPALRQWTRENCPSVGWADVERFRNYWLAKPGKDGRKIRWDLTWRNWAMKAQEDHIPQRPAHQDRATVDAAWSQWSDHGDELLAANGARNVLDLMW